MNIFAVSSCPIQAAKSLGDRHVVKMTLETAQILCAVHRRTASTTHAVPYRPTHLHHPCVTWTLQSLANYDWLVDHGFALAREYNYRFGPDKTHKSLEVIAWAAEHPPAIPEGPLAPFAQCIPEPFQVPPGSPVAAVVKAYRNAYRVDKAHLHQYTKRQPPSWLATR